MSLVVASSGAPEAKKFRFSLPTQVVVNDFDFEKNQGNGSAVLNNNTTVNNNNINVIKDAEVDKSEMMNDNEGDGYDNQFENGLDSTSKLPPSNVNCTCAAALSPGISTEPFDFPLAMFLLQQANNNFSHALNLSKATAPIPGAIAVAPAAQLFSPDDWSWHRNPYAAIRSGGTNKQTPVWKYFVYNKAENLSRCIIGNCRYILKGPHTSTLACHLKKHPVEYAEFKKSKLKFQQEYMQERNARLLSTNLSRTSQSSSEQTSAIQTPLFGGTPTPSVNSVDGNNEMLNSDVFNQIKPESTNASINSGIFGNSNAKNNHLGSKVPGKTASMTDILNILNASASENASPKCQQQPATPQKAPQDIQLPPQAHLHPQPPVMQITAAAANDPFILNSLKQNPNLMNNLNNNNNNDVTPNNNIPNVTAGSNVNPQSKNCVSPAKVIDLQKKWQRHNRKQREMEVKLSLAIAAAQLPTALIKNQFFRDFIETAQPKFTMPSEVNYINELINLQYARTVVAVKMQLAATPKITILIDVLKLQNLNQENIENGDYSTSKNLHKLPSIRLCVSAAYYSSRSQSAEVVLLGIRTPATDININDAIKDVLDQLLNEYNLEWDRISRTVTCGFNDLEANPNILPRMLAPYNRNLALSLIDIFDSDDMIVELKRDFYTMVFKFMERSDTMKQLSKQVGHNVTLPIDEPFLILAENILNVKAEFLAVCSQQDNPIPVFSESQWQQLEQAVKLLALFRVHMSVIQDGQYATIDRVIPSLMQLKVSLERDFSALGTLPHRLLEDLYQRTQYILDSTAENFDGSFIQATSLNPQFARLLNDSQMTFAKNSIKKLLSDRMRRRSDDSLTRKNGVKSNGDRVDALLAAVVERKNVSPSATVSPLLLSSISTTSDMNSTPNSSTTTSTLYHPDLIKAANRRRKQFQDCISNGKNLFAEAMVQSYFDDLMHTVASSPSSTVGGGTTPHATTTLPSLQFWQLSSVKCPQLSDIAIELLTIPSCTVSLEKILNDEGVSQIIAHSSLEHQLLKTMEDSERMERDAILRFNRAFIPKHF